MQGLPHNIHGLHLSSASLHFCGAGELWPFFLYLLPSSQHLGLRALTTQHEIKAESASLVDYLSGYGSVKLRLSGGSYKCQQLVAPTPHTMILEAKSGTKVSNCEETTGLKTIPLSRPPLFQRGLATRDPKAVVLQVSGST